MPPYSSQSFKYSITNSHTRVCLLIHPITQIPNHPSAYPSMHPQPKHSFTYPSMFWARKNETFYYGFGHMSTQDKWTQGTGK